MKGKRHSIESTGDNDWIYLRGMRLKCNIGVSERERRKKQVIDANIALKCDLRRAGKSGRIDDTIDYSILAKKIAARAENQSFRLLESLAENISAICLADSRIRQVTVKAAKAGVLSNVRAVEVSITRNRRP
jgi:FolB domain-containing protein